MKRFADLYERLDSTTSTNAKVAAMREYYAAAPPEDAAWGAFFLTGRRLERTVGWVLLRELCVEAAAMPPWLLDECYLAAGDLAETMALATAAPTERDDGPSLHEWVETRLLPLRAMDEREKRAAIERVFGESSPRAIFLFLKMLTGELRVGVQKTLGIRALAEHAGLPPEVVAHRLMGDYAPSASAFRALVDPDASDADVSRPYPFCLAHPLETGLDPLGPIAEWAAEWKWDGIRAQLVRRDGRTFLWSRGEEAVAERYPEVVTAARGLPDGTVLDGELLAWRDGAPLPFGALQQRIGRKKLSRAILERVPVALIAFDVLEDGGVDLRAEPFDARRARLEALLARHGSPSLAVSELVPATSMEELEALRRSARERGVEGLMLKRRTSPYYAGRKKGDWWKYKIDPLTVDAVLIYAQPGHGKRASLITDYGFGVWSGEKLVPIAQAYSGLDDAEIGELDRWIRANTVERHGPVRRVPPVHVFELGFEAIRRSTRHSSGVAVRFPRILRWRRDKPVAEADRIETLLGLVAEDRWEPSPGAGAKKQLDLFEPE